MRKTDACNEPVLMNNGVFLDKPEYLFPASFNLCLECGVIGRDIILCVSELFFQYLKQFFDFSERFFAEKDFQLYLGLHFIEEIFQGQPDCLK